MDATAFGKQMIGFYKTMFDNSYAALLGMQEQMQKMLATQLDSIPGFPEDGKKVIIELTKSYKKLCEDFKASADDNFKRAESFFSTAWGKK
ncbi:MAG: hypothetical protein PHW43_04370 [Syntrophales bacterium]|nr:hypothetical protein [Syntrophales bacterium]